MGYKIRRALLSVSDKSGIVEFARGLEGLGVELLSTGGTERLLRENGLNVRAVSDWTGFPEMLDGRVKTLHPKIHAGLLARRDKKEHMDALKKNDIQTIDLVAVNLYPFRETVAKAGVSLEEAIENIDIGGPTMLRSAAKNYGAVAVVVKSESYRSILDELKKNGCELSQETRQSLILDVFKLTSEYDTAIFNYLSSVFAGASNNFPGTLTLSFEKVQGLRYGENPHQSAAFYRERGKRGLDSAVKLQGKELSYNNLIDLDAALEMLRDFRQEPAAIIIKHTNPCGLAQATTLAQAYTDALACDELSAFGSVVGLNREVDGETARAIHSASFVEAVLAPGFTSEARNILKDKENMRLLSLEEIPSGKGIARRYIKGGALFQDEDVVSSEEKYTTVTDRKTTDDELISLKFAWRVAKLVKSNAIVLTKGSKTVGIGAGQMSRVDAVIIAVRKAGERASGSVLASDAFFPFPDAIREAHKAGIRAIVQPGGAKKDSEVIEAANACHITMVFTGRRHFRH